MSVPQSQLATPHVLVAEEDAARPPRLAQLLGQHGYRVSSAANGRVAFELALRHKPDVVITEMIMPEMNGYELCARIKADPALAEFPVILVSTLSDPEDVIHGLECGADDLVFKPFDAKHLLRRVGVALANRRGARREPRGSGVEIAVGERKHVVTADRLRILDLLLSTYETARHLNVELEERVRSRTRELEQSNELLRQSQLAVIQQERMRALGQMASGIAHDINNAISPISLYTETMLEREALSERARGYLTTIQRALDEVSQTIGRMREFYRPREQEPQLADVELNPLVQQVIDLTRARWNDRAQQRGVTIAVKSELADNLPTIRGADSEIRDALTNLIFNAVDALPDGGTIAIRTARASQPGAPRGEQACALLEVADTGVGMDEETRRRCIEPFFTTKGARGAGLGLAMVYGTAKRHGAALDIESRPGSGTTVRLTFRADQAQVAASGRHPAPLFAARSLRVLLIDDDPSLIESLRTALQDEGHKVTAASGGRAGIEAFRDAQKTGKLFDIVITDLAMPYVDGRQVIASVRGMSPGTPIILLTGWGQHVAGDHERPLQVDRLLGKPPRIRELRAALAELTGRRATDRLG